MFSSGLWDGQDVENDAQVRRYEAIAEDFDDKATFHLLRNNHWVLDSRIPPKGLVVDPETDPLRLFTTDWVPISSIDTLDNFQYLRFRVDMSVNPLHDFTNPLPVVRRIEIPVSTVPD